MQPIISFLIILSVSAEQPAESFLGREKHISREITDYIGWNWNDHYISYYLQFDPKEMVRSDSIVVESEGKLAPFQVLNPEIKKGRLLGCEVHFRASVPALTKKVWNIWYSRKRKQPVKLDSGVSAGVEGETLQITNRHLTLKLLSGNWKGQMVGSDASGPFLGVRSKADQVFRLSSGFSTSQKLVEWKAGIISDGPLFVDYEAEFRFEASPENEQHPLVARSAEEGAFYRFQLRLYADSEYALIKEDYGGLAREDFFYISFSNGFEPTTSNAVQHNTGEKTYRIQSPDKPHTFFIIPCWHVNADYAGPRTDWFGLYSEKESDYLGIFRIDGNLWKYPVFNIVRAVDAKDGVRAEFPIMAGHRRWGLYAGKKQENVGRMSVTSRSYSRSNKARIHQAIQRESEFPLQTVKKWILGHGEPGKPMPFKMWHPIRAVTRVLNNGFSDNETAPPALVRFMRLYLLKYRGKFYDDENKTLDALYLFWAYTMWDEEYYEWKRFHLGYGDPDSIQHLYGKGVPNFNTDRYSCVAFTALALPDHPLAKTFIEHGRSQMNLQFREFFYESGVYQEGGDYYGHVLGLFYDLFNIYKTEFGIDLFTSSEDYFSRFKRSLAAWCHLQFPDGTMPIMGDGAMGTNPTSYFQFILKAADHYDKSDPAFAAHLRWCANRNLNKPGGKPLPMGSVNLGPTGLVFRAGFCTPKETMIFLRVGPTWSHWHSDQGQIQCRVMGGKVAPVWSTCSGAHNYVAASGPHQTIAVGGRVLQGGNIERFYRTDFADLGIAHIDGAGKVPDVLRRHVLFLRNDCFLIYDQIKSDKPSHFQPEGFSPKFFRFIDGGKTDRKPGEPFRSIIDWTGRKTKLLADGACILVTKDLQRDYCFLMDESKLVEVEGVKFEGRYGAVRMRPGRADFALFDASRAEASGVVIHTQPKSMTITGKLQLENDLDVTVALGSEIVPVSVDIDGKSSNSFDAIRSGVSFRLTKSNREFRIRYLHKTWKSGATPHIWAVGRTGITSNSARITWTADQPGEASVEYGTTPKFGGIVKAEGIGRTGEVRLNNLPSNKKIHFIIRMKGIEGKNASSQGEPFVTRHPGTRTPSLKDSTIRFGAQGSSLKRESDLGARVTRFEIAWDHLFSERGKFNHDRLETIAHQLGAYRKAGIEPVVLLTYCHDWAQTYTDRQATWYHPFFGPPDHVTDWKKFIRPIMKRLKGVARWYEIWNEPDGHYLADNAEPGQPTIFGRPAGEADPEFHDNTRYWLQDRYVPLVMAAREVADEIDPAIRLMAPSWNHDYHGGRADLCFEVGLHHYIDAYSFHAYIGPPQNYGRWHHWTFDTYFKHIDRVFKKHGVDLPLVITEWGFSARKDFESTETDHQTEADQAALIAKAMLAQSATSRIKLSVLYCLEGSEFGLTRNAAGKPFKPRPSHRVFKTLSSLLGTTAIRPSERVRIEPAEGIRLIALELPDKKQTLIALWPSGWDDEKQEYKPAPERRARLICKADRRAKIRPLQLFEKRNDFKRPTWNEGEWSWEVDVQALSGKKEVPPRIFVVRQ